MLHAHHDLPRLGLGQETLSDRSARKIRNRREGAVKHAFSEADLMQACLQWTKVNAYSVGSATHAEKCRTSTAAQPILPSRNSLHYQLDIS